MLCHYVRFLFCGGEAFWLGENSCKVAVVDYGKRPHACRSPVQIPVSPLFFSRVCLLSCAPHLRIKYTGYCFNNKSLFLVVSRPPTVTGPFYFLLVEHRPTKHSSTKEMDHLQPPPQFEARISVPEPKSAMPARATVSLHAHRPKTYRLVLHSEDRIAGSPTAATFDLGDLAAAWNLAVSRDNLDAGTKHYTMRLDSFYMSCQNATPAIVQVYGVGFPSQSESFDSQSQSSTELLGVAAGAVNAGCGPQGGSITLSSVPSGRISIKLVTRDYGDTLQTDMANDATLRWHMVLCMQACTNSSGP